MSAKLIGICIIFIPHFFLAAGAGDSAHFTQIPSSLPPHINQYILTSPPGRQDVITPLEAITRGGLNGTEGGVGLLVKSLIIAIPTAIYLAFTKIRDWHISGNKKRDLQEEYLITERAKVVVAHTKYAIAMSNLLKAREQLQVDLAKNTAFKQESLEEIWQRVCKNTATIPLKNELEGVSPIAQ